jgi:hypothetical protein
MFEVKEGGKDEIATSEDGRKNVVRKNVQPKVVAKVGEIAHYHHKENETESWDEPCHFVDHTVRDAKGYSLNEVRYVGKVVVSQCIADYLAWQESIHQEYEQGIFRSTKLNKVVGSY